MRIRGVGLRSVVATAVLVAVNVAAPLVAVGQASAAVNCYAYITTIKGVDTGVAHCDGSRSSATTRSTRTTSTSGTAR